jgi:hypothetical protein
MSKRDEVLSEVRLQPHDESRLWDTMDALQFGVLLEGTTDEVDTFRSLMARIAAGARAAVASANPADTDWLIKERLDARHAKWDGEYRNTPADWCDELVMVAANGPAEIAAVAIDAIMSVDDQRALEGKTFYEIVAI